MDNVPNIGDPDARVMTEDSGEAVESCEHTADASRILASGRHTASPAFVTYLKVQGIRFDSPSSDMHSPKDPDNLCLSLLPEFPSEMQVTVPVTDK